MRNTGNCIKQHAHSFFGEVNPMRYTDIVLNKKMSRFYFLFFSPSFLFLIVSKMNEVPISSHIRVTSTRIKRL